MVNRVSRQSQGEMPHPDNEELGAIKTLLVAVIMKDASLDRDEIYSFISGDGKKIIWN